MATTSTASTPRVWAHIDLAALRHNFARVEALAAGARIMPALKANAYGHGAIEVARALPRADGFGVATLAEAVSLREGGCDQPIVLLSGISAAAELAAVREHALIPVIHSDWQLEAMAAAGPMRCWVKIDTGMGRLGFAADQAGEIHRRIAASGNLELVGWMSHLACADDPGNAHTQAQIARFEATLEGLPGDRSLANSAGIMAWPAAREDWVRPGIMLYGGSPLAGKSAAELGLRPVMSLHARLISVKTLQPGESVGYGAEFRCEQPTPVGIVAAGYADGLPRALGNGCPVAFENGRRGAIAGRVSMDLIAIDLSENPSARPGDTVTFWGEPISVDETAARAGTIGYELLVALGGRVERVYSGA